MNTENNSRICKLYLQFDESNIEHAQARKITEACIRSNNYNPALGSFIKLAEKGDRAFQHNTGVLMQCIRIAESFFHERSMLYFLPAFVYIYILCIFYIILL